MSLPSQSMFHLAKSPLAVLACAIIWILWKVLGNYFVRSPLDNIPGPQPSSVWKGNFGPLFSRHGWSFHDTEIGEKYHSVVKLTGLFGRKYLYVFDPKALRSIVLKDQDSYEEASWFLAANRLIFGPGLVSTIGERHKKQRKMLNPVFSVGHMRHLTPIFYGVTQNLRDAIASQVQDKPKEIDVMEWIGRTALELVGQGGLGYSFDPLKEDVPNAFGDAIKAVLPTMFSVLVFRMIIPIVSQIGTPTFRRWIVDRFPNKNVQRMKVIVDTMEAQSKEIFYEKKAAVKSGDPDAVQRVGEGKDIMSTLLKANISASENDKLPDSELIAQMSILVVGAMDTTSSALVQTLQLLAENPDVQDKLRKEITDSRYGDSIPHDELVELPYLDAVVRETLRLHPPVTFVFRETLEDTMMPLYEPIDGLDGNRMNEVAVPKGTGMLIGIRACNRNKRIWGDDAHEWKPERWLSPLPSAVTDARIPGVYSNLMTFLGGGRACIGFKFSQLEMKVVLSILVESFKFSLPEKEIIWNLAGVKYPTTDKSSLKASLPLKIELVRKHMRS